MDPAAMLWKPSFSMVRQRLPKNGEHRNHHDKQHAAKPWKGVTEIDVVLDTYVHMRRIWLHLPLIMVVL
jgi:hypothetical protein